MGVMVMNDIHYPSLFLIALILLALFFLILISSSQNVPANGSWGAWV